MSEEQEGIPRWKTLSSRTVAENPFLKLEEQRREEEGSGKQGDFFIVDAPDWANICAITEEGDVVLIEQFRQGTETIELEVPGGIVGRDEAPADAVVRELLEETGYEPTGKSELRQIESVFPNPAFINNTCYSYLLTNVRLSGETSFDEHENIRVRLVPRSEIDGLITRGEIKHSLTIVSLYWMVLAGY